MNIKATLQRRYSGLLVVALLVVGFAIRMWAIDYGLPNVYHMEEPFYTQAAWNMVCEGNVNSSLLQLHTYLYALSIASDNVLQNQTLCVSQNNIPGNVYLLGRIVSVALGAATIYVTYRLGKALFSEPIGILGALFIAFNFLHVRESQHGTPDITGVFLVSLALLSYIRLSKPNASRFQFMLAGVVTALAINSRLTNFLLIPILLYAHFLAQDFFKKPNWRDFWRILFDVRLLWAGFVTVIVFLLVNPQIWVDPIGYLRYWRSFFKLGSLGGFGELQVDPLPAPLYYVRSIEWGAGILLSIVCGLGVIWAMYRRKLGDVFLAGYIIPYFLLASFSSVYFARYIIPIIPLLGLLAARFLWEVVPEKRRLASIAVIVVVLLAQPILWIVEYSHLQLQTDTRTLAEAWIDENIPPGVKIATEWHTVINTSNYQVTAVDFAGLSISPLDQYVQDGFQYVVVTSFIRDTVMISPDQEARKISFYTDLAQRATLLQEFKPYSGTEPPFNIDQVLGPITSLDQFDRPGPTIEIYQLPTTTESPSPAG